MDANNRIRNSGDTGVGTRRVCRTLEAAAAAMNALGAIVVDTVRDRVWGRKTDSVGTGGINTHFDNDDDDDDNAGDADGGADADGPTAKAAAVAAAEAAATIAASFTVNRRACSSVARSLSQFDRIAVVLAQNARRTLLAASASTGAGITGGDQPYPYEFAALLGFCASILRLDSALKRLQVDNERSRPRKRRSIAVNALAILEIVPFLVAQTTNLVKHVQQRPTVCGDLLAYINSSVSDFVVSVCSMASVEVATPTPTPAPLAGIPFTQMLFLAWIALGLDGQQRRAVVAGAFDDESRAVEAVKTLLSRATPADLAIAQRFVRQKCAAVIQDQRRQCMSWSPSTVLAATEEFDGDRGTWRGVASLQMLRFLCSCRGSWWQKAHASVLSLVLEVVAHTARCRASGRQAAEDGSENVVSVHQARAMWSMVGRACVRARACVCVRGHCMRVSVSLFARCDARFHGSPTLPLLWL